MNMPLRSHSGVLTRPPNLPPTRTSCFWKVFFGIATATLVGVVFAIFVLNSVSKLRTDANKKDAAISKTEQDAVMARNDAATARANSDQANRQVQYLNGLVQSIQQTLNDQAAKGLLRQDQISAIAAEISAMQAARGKGLSVAGGKGSEISTLPGDANLPFLTSFDLEPSSASTSASTAGCLLTLISPVLKLDGTICPG